VQGKSGTVFPTMAVDRMFTLLGSLDGLVAQCQAVQRTAGELEFHVVPGKPLDQAARICVEEFFSGMMPHYFADAMDHRIVFVDAIPHGAGKFLEFVSELPRGS